MLFKFREFPVYKDALVFRKKIKNFSDRFPKHELYSLSSQINRAAISIVLNIAERPDRYSDIDFSRFLNNSVTSLCEVVACLDIALEDKYIDEKEYEDILVEADKMARQLKAFSAKVRNTGKNNLNNSLVSLTLCFSCSSILLNLWFFVF